MKTMKGMIMAWIASVISLGFLLSGFWVGVDPRSSMFMALFSMSFPAWIAAMVVVSVVAGVLRAKWAMIILLMSWIIGAYNVCSFSPWNISRKADDDETTLKIMTYNVYQFRPADSDSLLDYNPTLNSIIHCGADIVALQESYSLNAPIRWLKITQQQCDTIALIYPYSRYVSEGLSLLSKYPFEEIPLDEYPSGSAQFAAYLVQIPGHDDIALFNVHLQSFRLNDADRKIYRELTDGEMSREVLKEARYDIIPKVKKALASHAVEAEMLVRDINSTWEHGPMIVCGDFNDVLGSFPVKTLCRDCNLRDAYRDGAFGPTYTYHGSRFYFNIDHILYRGLSRPLYTKRLKVPSSDHYPLIAEFRLPSDLSATE